MLIKTADAAAKNVDIRYKEMTVLNLPSGFLSAPVKDESTKINTKIGAIAFKLPTNNWPKIFIKPKLGKIKAIIIPATIPKKIFNAKFPLLNKLIIKFNVPYSLFYLIIL